MIVKKVCMVGAFAVGKTSLVRRFVESIYSEKYQTTIGVKISKKQVELSAQNVQLMIWDIEGVDIFTEFKASYLRGAGGILLVIDGTRPKSYERTNELLALIRREVADIPILLLANKYDLTAEWQLDFQWLKSMADIGIDFFMTSAKNGDNVDEAFRSLTHKMLESNQKAGAS